MHFAAVCRYCELCGSHFYNPLPYLESFQVSLPAIVSLGHERGGGGATCLFVYFSNVLICILRHCVPIAYNALRRAHWVFIEGDDLKDGLL